MRFTVFLSFFGEQGQLWKINKHMDFLFFIVGRVVLELYQGEFPNTVRNFLALVTGEGKGSKGQQLSYKVRISFKTSALFTYTKWYLE